nr:hypothetical protein [Tanacetum cinerariifolium]
MHSPSSSGSLPSNTIANPKGEIKAIITRSGIILDRPSVLPHPPPFASSKEVEHEPEPIMDQPPILYPSRLNKENLQDKSDIQIHKFLQMFKKLYFKISLAEALALMPKLESCMALADLGSCEEVLKIKKSNLPSSGSTTPLSDSLPSLTPFETSDSVLEEFADELALLDLFPPGNEDDNFDAEADLRKIEYLPNQDPLTESGIEIIDPILERFTNAPALDYSPPSGYGVMTMMIFFTLSLIMMNGKSFCMVTLTRILTLKKLKTRTLK